MTSNRKNSQAGIAHLVPLLAVVIVVVVAAGVYIARNQSDSAQLASSQSSTDSSGLNQPLPADLLTVTKVKELAAVQKPDIAIVGVELEQEDGVLVYKVKLADGSVLNLDAKTGKLVTKTEKNSQSNTGEEPLVAGTQPAISFDKAREIALQRKPGGVIRKIELEQENGKLVYSVRFTDDARVDVAASDGSVVREKAGGTSSGSGSNSGSGSSGGSSGDDASDEEGGSHSGRSGSGSSGSGSGGSDDDGRDDH